MTPEEKERLQAETAKLKAETKNLKKSHWGSLTTYVSLAVGAFAVAGSVGQYQLSALSSGEEALEADKRIFNAQIEERRLTEQNVELEERAAQLLRDVDNSTKAIRELQAQIESANTHLIEAIEQVENQPVLVASIRRDVATRQEQVETIVGNAEKRNSRVQLENQFRLLNSDDRDERRSTLQILLNDYKSDQTAIDIALGMLFPPILETLSTEGRINVLHFLKKTDGNAWTDDQRTIGKRAVATIERTAYRSAAALGTQTRGEIEDFKEFLNAM